MSALPLPRVRRRQTPLQRPAPADRLVRQAARDPDLSGTDVRLLVWLDEWFDLHPGTYPTKAQAADELHLSVDTISRSLGRMADRGYISRRRPDVRPGPLIDYDLAPPRIGVAAVPSDRFQGDLFADSKPQICGLGPAEMRATPGTPAGCCAAAPPHTPPVFEEFEKAGSARAGSQPASPFLSDKDPSEEEADAAMLSRLMGRALLLKNATEAKVRAAIQAHGVDRLEYALDQGEARKPVPAESWGYVLRVLWRMEREGDGPRETVSDPPPGPAPRQNYNPGPKYSPAPPEEAAAWRDWRSFARSLDSSQTPKPAPEGEKTPAAGSLAKVPPPPVPEMYCRPAPSESYPLERGSARPAAELQTPHDAGQCARLPDHAKAASFQASQTIQPPKKAAGSDEVSNNCQPITVVRAGDSVVGSTRPSGAGRGGPPDRVGWDSDNTPPRPGRTRADPDAGFAPWRPERR